MIIPDYSLSDPIVIYDNVAKGFAVPQLSVEQIENLKQQLEDLETRIEIAEASH
jgi:hypothetical protein